MGKKIKRNKTKLVIIILSLILVLLININIVVIINNNKLLNEEKLLTKTYNDNSNNLNKETDKIKEIESEINNLNALDSKVTTLKEDYFKAIKSLEDNILSGKSKVKIAYLTFDDGPYYNTYKVLDILDKYNVKATFFTTSVNGTKCFDNPKENCTPLYKEYVKRGHTIANHTYTHGIFKGLYNSTTTFIDAVKKQEEKIKTETNGYVTNIVRFPGGSATAGRLKSAIVTELRKMHYGYVDWTAEDGDGGNLTSTTAAWNTFTSTINSNIEVILFHDYSPYTTEILPKAIEYLKNKGYLILPLFYESNMINK